MTNKSSPIPFSQVPALSALKSGFPSLKGLFFDMDGTLFNTEAIHAEAMLMIAARYKIRPPYSPEAVHQLMMGKADHLVFEIIKDWEGVPSEWTATDFIREKNANIIELLKKTPLETYFYTDVGNLLRDAKAQGLYLALVTSSEKLVTEELLKITKMESFFHLVLTRDDCPKHKPDPWPYLKAAELSKLEKHEFLIFEDSHVGLEAATLAAPHVIKVEWYT